MELTTDFLVIGGGINGVGIAADAAGRGLKVVLCEQHDLASGTSQTSSKLIHGGLRYLERFDFRLVREALQEREILLKKAPHLISPLSFVMPYQPQLRPYWLIRFGLYLYDHLGKRRLLPKSQAISFRHHAAGNILQSHYIKGFIYTDCLVDDARLVITNALAAAEHGATILTRTLFVTAKRDSKVWRALLKNTETGDTFTVEAKAIINAAGPWAEEVLRNRLQQQTKYQLALVKGSHIIVSKLYDEKFAFLLQLRDSRIVFVIPYLDHFSLIGTTDVIYTGEPSDVAISSMEIDYLCEAVNNYFNKKITASDIVWSYAGLRPLQKSHETKPENISRDYQLVFDSPIDQAPLLSVFGGKITTYRRLAEHTLHYFQPIFPHMQSAWTANALLPGAITGKELQVKYPWLPTSLLHRYQYNYGALAQCFLRQAQSITDLGDDFGHGLYERELEYLLEEEWAKTTEDILWRRTKLGLYFTAEQEKKLAVAIKNKLNQ